MKKIFTLFIVVFGFISAFAYDVEVDGIYYNLNKENKTANVTYKYYSEDTYFNSDYSGKVIIPSSIQYLGVEYSVTSIDYFSFYGCSGLSSVSIPNSVTLIGFYAFAGCSGLTSIIIPSSVTSIGPCAFFGCEGLTEVIIPKSVTSIGDEAFEGCTSLSYIFIPESVTSIGWGAFWFCSALTIAEFESIESLCSIQFGSHDSNPLYYAKHLYINGSEVNNLVIPNSVSIIGDYSFVSCSYLSSISIPNSVTSIGNRAFADCSGLTSITIPESVSSIGVNAFKGCTNVEELIYAEGCKKVLATNLTSVKKVTIPSSVKSIDVDAFINYSSLSEMICHCSRIPTTDGNIFSGSGYADGVLYVPADAIIKYESAYPWYGWGDIKAIEEENALDVVLPDKGQKQYYSLDGNKSVTSSNGLYIIRNEDGSVQKVMVK